MLLLHWTTLVTLVLCVLHAVVAAQDQYGTQCGAQGGAQTQGSHKGDAEDAALRAARAATLALVMEICSCCDLHAVSVLLAAPTLVALGAGAGFEALHALRYGSAYREAQAIARQQWSESQRAQLVRAVQELIAARALSIEHS